MRALIITAIVILALACASIFYFNRKITHSHVDMLLKGQPTMGDKNAKVQITVFTDPKCPSCKTFQLHLLPFIKKKYVDKGLATFSEVPVSILPGSHLLAAAWLCVYHQNPGAPHPDRFFRFVQVSFENQGPVRLNWADETAILKLAGSSSSKIDMDKLKFCVENLNYEDEVENNTLALKKNLGGIATVPSIWVNGQLIKKQSLSALEERIEKALKNNK